MNVNPLIEALLGQLQSKNPNGFNFVNGMMKNGGNADAFLKQILSNVTPEQKQQLLNQAKGYGVPDSYLSQIQNMK